MNQNHDKPAPGNPLWRFFISIPRVLCGIGVAIVSVVLFLTVVFRYFLQMPLGWTEELSRMLFMWVVFLGSAVCAGQERHAKFELFVKNLKPKSQLILDVAGSLLILFITIVFIYKGFQAYKLISFERFVILDIPYASAYLALPTGMILIFIYYCHHFFVKVKQIWIIRKTDEGSEIKNGTY